MLRLLAALVAFGSIVAAIALAAPEKDGATAAAGSSKFFTETTRPFLEKYCFDCHSGDDPEGGIRLDVFANADAAAKDHETWDRVRHKLRAHEMPPKDELQPTEAERDAVARWIERLLDDVDGTASAHPGRVTIRRLNRVEYTNTIRDLLAVEFNAAEDFPADDVGYGFDNIGDVLTLPPLLMEKYLDAAEQIAGKAIVTDRPDAKPEDLPESHRRIFFVRPGENGLSVEEAGRRVIRRLASRAYRRPVTDGELKRLTDLGAMAYKDGATFEESVQLVLQAVLVSPQFLFRVEKDPTPDDPDGVRELDEFELATRLSYFLWSSMPDEDLFEQARNGTLRKNLESQVRRMLRDPKSQALVTNFAGQWLELRNLDSITPDKEMFGTFDDELRRAMREETERFFTAIMREDRSVLDLIDADYTFVNETLARHYGLPGVKGPEFRRVSLKGTPRGGVITQASVLAVTSNPTRTSPVKRGKWILENILGTPPPDPPPGVPMLAEDEKARLSGSLRERMEQHRKDPNCAVCHRKMDALGFALENFDAVGAWRTRDGKFEIDPSGELPDGQTFAGPEQLRKILKNSARGEFVRCLTEKMLTYALGRGLERYDKRAVDKTAKRLAEDGYRFSTLVVAIVNSDPFQKRSRK